MTTPTTSQNYSFSYSSLSFSAEDSPIQSLTPLSDACPPKNSKEEQSFLERNWTYVKENPFDTALTVLATISAVYLLVKLGQTLFSTNATIPKPPKNITEKIIKQKNDTVFDMFSGLSNKTQNKIVQDCIAKQSKDCDQLVLDSFETISEDVLSHCNIKPLTIASENNNTSSNATNTTESTSKPLTDQDLLDCPVLDKTLAACTLESSKDSTFCNKLKYQIYEFNLKQNVENGLLWYEGKCQKMKALPEDEECRANYLSELFRDHLNTKLPYNNFVPVSP